MDLPPPVPQKSYERIMRKINLASREVADDSMKNVVKEEVSASGKLQRTAPYSIEKVECVSHIERRMGARLRKLKTMNRGKKLSDGKSISGKNRLTDNFIDTQLPPIMAMLLNRIIAP
ncbi:hypothetical protein TNCV_4409961 [Trichonephila clavipes]|nr:hypothetical protein TNCV_4409961 [Trichonephila clavipes]